MVDDVVVHQLLHQADARLSIWGFLVVNQPVRELLRHKAVGISSEVVTPVLNELPIVQAKPGERNGHRAQLARHGHLNSIAQPSLGNLPMGWDSWKAPSDLKIMCNLFTFTNCINTSPGASFQHLLFSHSHFVHFVIV